MGRKIFALSILVFADRFHGSFGLAGSLPPGGLAQGRPRGFHSHLAEKCSASGDRIFLKSLLGRAGV